MVKVRVNALYRVVQGVGVGGRLSAGVGSVYLLQHAMSRSGKVKG